MWQGWIVTAIWWTLFRQKLSLVLFFPLINALVELFFFFWGGMWRQSQCWKVRKVGFMNWKKKDTWELKRTISWNYWCYSNLYVILQCMSCVQYDLLQLNIVMTSCDWLVLLFVYMLYMHVYSNMCTPTYRQPITKHYTLINPSEKICGCRLFSVHLWQLSGFLIYHFGTKDFRDVFFFSFFQASINSFLKINQYQHGSSVFFGLRCQWPKKGGPNFGERWTNSNFELVSHRLW